MPPKKVTTSKPGAKTSSKTTGKAGGKAKTGAKAEPKGAAAAPPPPPPPPPITSVGLKAIPGIVEKSQGPSSESNKWALIIDEQGTVGTFFKYRNASYIQADLPGEMVPEKLRLALLGALRYGKPLVIDCGEKDVGCVELLNDVEEGLCDSLLSRSLLQNEKYTSLVQPSDDKDYQANMAYFTENFAFVLVTKETEPNATIANKFDCFKIE